MPKLFDDEFLSAQARLAEQASRIAKAGDILGNSELTRAMEQARTFSDTIARIYRDPLLDIQSRLDSLQVSPAIAAYVQEIESYNDRFSLPAQTQIAALADALPHLPSVEALGLAHDRLSAIESAVRRIREPWVHIENSLASITAVSELHTVAAGILEQPPFGEALAVVLRRDFGDWRSVSAFPDAILTDPPARFDFYRQRGFDDALTDFPQPAFSEILDSTGLRRAIWPEAAEDYRHGLDLEPDEEAEDEVPSLNLEAYGLIYRLETHLRCFIDERMTAEYGPFWVKQRTPDGVYPEWRRKRQEAIDAGFAPQPLIAYADFTDYSRIICRNDNWKVFAPFFGRKTDIQESLIRLGPARVCTMHVRVIMPDDHLMMLAEVTRILRAIGVQV